MEPANKPPLSLLARFKQLVSKRGLKEQAPAADQVAIDFLPDADEIERRPLPRVAHLTLHVVAAAFICFLLWSSLSEVDLIVVAKGKLVTPLPNIVVQPLETSIIQSIDVRSGQIVKKGERLATLDPTFTEADESQLRTRLRSLDNQLERLEHELSGSKTGAIASTDADSLLQARLSRERRASYTAQVRRLDESIGRLRATQETNRRDQQVLASRVRLLKEMEEMQLDLVAKKYAVRSRLLEAQDRALEAERSLEMAKNRQVEITRELAALEAEKTSFETGWRQKMMEELLSISRERDSVNEQLQKADKRNRLVVLTSPADAVVLEIAKLSQEVHIDSLDVGYLKVGDTAHVKFDAYPFQKHGSLDAELRTLSEDAFQRNTSPGTTLDVFYTGRIRLKSTRLKKMPEQAKLLPGMTVNAEIVVGKRTVLSYLLWPLTKAINESIREP